MAANCQMKLGLRSLAKEADDGRNVRVAVIDTGIPSSRVLKVHMARNFTSDDSPDPGHATFIGSMLFGDGSHGVEGICPNATACFAKVFENGTARPKTVAQAIEYAVDVWNADILNLSLGFTGDTCDEDLRHACWWAQYRGAVLVAPSGNDGGGTMWPAALPGVISVGASDGKGKESFSNHGKVNVVAPGVDIEGLDVEGNVVKYTGTSFSAATVTGLLALLLARRRAQGITASARSVRRELMDMCVDLGKKGWDEDTGFGFPFPELVTACKNLDRPQWALPLCAFFGKIKEAIGKAFAALTRRKKDDE